MDHRAQLRVVAGLFAIFSGLALVLASAGPYSVVSYGVATRTDGFGIRIALGVRAVNVVWNVLKGMAVNVGAGLIAGPALSLIFDTPASRWVNASSPDQLILGGISVWSWSQA